MGMMIYPWMAIFDLQILYSNIKKPFKCTEEMLDDYTIIVPVFNKPSYLQNLAYLRRYRDRVIIASVSDQSMEMEYFLAGLRKEGFRVSILDLHSSAAVSTRSSQPDPTTYYSLMKHPLELGVYDALRRISVEYVRTKYVCFLDGDSIPEGDFGKPCAVLEKEGLDVASVKVLPSSKSNLIERMQWIEYSIAMRSRHYYPWLTSGASCIVRTSVLKEIMRNHSLYFLGGDIEIGILARLTGKKIANIDFTVFTDVPSTFTKWFRQRIDWFCGAFRLSIINFDKHLRQPIFLAYMAGLVFLVLPLKLFGILMAWWIVPLVMLLYIPITFANWQVRDRYMFLFPLYGGFQSLVLPPLGFLRYLQLLIRYKKVGRISQNRYHKQKGNSERAHQVAPRQTNLHS
jgi:hypothetical protein